MRCYVCDVETPPMHRYCDRCRTFFKTRRENTKRRNALREAYDRTCDGFRCYWSGVVLDDRDSIGPFHPCFDHLTPDRTSELVMSSELFNRLKMELTPDEFKRVTQELASHHRGKPFAKDCIAFENWRRKAHVPSGRGGRHGKVTNVEVEACVICGHPPSHWSYYCPRCSRLIEGEHISYRQRVNAMKAAWSPAKDGFICQFTGVVLDDSDPSSPWYLSFDHGIPGDKESIIVAAFWLNEMKSSLKRDDFWAVVLEYDRYLREGGEFDRDVAGFRYWRRTRRTSA